MILQRTFFMYLVFGSLGLTCWGEEASFPGTKLLTTSDDLSVENLKAVDRFFVKQIERSVDDRRTFWQRDYSGPIAYHDSIQTNRDRLRRRIGIVDQRQPGGDLQLVATLNTPAVVAESDRVRITAVRWRVFDDADAEGLLLEPTDGVRALVVAVPDADSTPERLAGLDPLAPPQAAIALRLAEAGCRVLVPTLIDRNTTWSGNPRVRMTNQTHREFIYRQAFLMGRHLIGYEVQMVLAGVDYFSALPQESEQPIGVAGYGEGALIAFYAAAVDERIDSALVSGYFQPREQLHREPVYRNVYGLLREFGDADIASLVAPRALVIEACRAPRAPDPPPLIDGRNYAAYGKLWTPKLEEVRREFALAKTHFQRLDIEDRIALVASDGGQGPPGTQAALVVFLESLGIDKESHDDRVALRDRRARFDPTDRMKRQFDQWTNHTQRLVRQSRFRRAEFWKDADSSSTEKWSETTVRFRELLWDEVIGRLPQASLRPNPRTRLVYDTPQWKGYEVVLDVYPGVFQYGMLLVPKDLQPDERRPVVVAQHGRNATPRHVCTPDEDTYAYHSFGAQLADRGFVVYAPQNLYIFEEHSRAIQRKAFALGMTFFAAMVRQHEQALTWLGSLPFVDSARIGFYGLSYGGKSSLLIPAVLEGYCLSICSADFNEEVWKHTSIEDRCSFMFTLEHEHTEFDFGERFNYAEIAGLIAPRPFMVERGHHDDVAPDEWVAYEYAKVRRLYLALGIRDRTEIEFFDGEHEINSQGTFEFLHKHLAWPRR